MILNFGLTPKNYAPFGGAANDADAQAFIDAAGITDATQKSAVNQLVLDLKSANIWTKMKALYPIVGGTAATHKWNLKNPLDTDAAFRLTFSLGWTHSSNGMLPNGTSAFANTFLNTATNLSLNSGHLSYYSRTNNTTSAIDLGTLKSGPDSYSDLVLYFSGNAYTRFNNTGPYNTVASTNTSGYFIGSRTASNVIKTFRNGSVIINGNAASSATSTINFYIGAVNNNGSTQFYTNRQCAFASIGDGLTDAEAVNFNTAVTTYQTTLGRNV
jgi:hypothetical protein